MKQMRNSYLVADSHVTPGLRCNPILESNIGSPEQWSETTVATVFFFDRLACAWISQLVLVREASH